jgi:hypothetical protein
MTSKKQVQSYNTNKHHLLIDDLDNLANNDVYPIPKFSKKNKEQKAIKYFYFLFFC